MTHLLIYYKVERDRATYIGDGYGRDVAEALADFRRKHRHEAVTVLRYEFID